MENLKNGTEKLCSFYVSEWHLATMVLPYINKEINEKANITTILENNLENNIKTLIAKLNLKSEKEILEIDWKEKTELKIFELTKKLEEFLKKESEKNIILINGSKNYIDTANECINKFLKQNVSIIKNKTIKIINCYEVTEFNNNISQILEQHNKILNTSGEKYIYEVFDGYENIQKIC